MINCPKRKNIFAVSAFKDKELMFMAVLTMNIDVNDVFYVLHSVFQLGYKFVYLCVYTILHGGEQFACQLLHSIREELCVCALSLRHHITVRHDSEHVCLLERQSV